MYCAQCGEEIPEFSKFCPQCGAVHGETVMLSGSGAVVAPGQVVEGGGPRGSVAEQMQETVLDKLPGTDASRPAMVPQSSLPYEAAQGTTGVGATAGAVDKVPGWRLALGFFGGVAVVLAVAGVVFWRMGLLPFAGGSVEDPVAVETMRSDESATGDAAAVAAEGTSETAAPDVSTSPEPSVVAEPTVQEDTSDAQQPEVAPSPEPESQEEATPVVAVPPSFPDATSSSTLPPDGVTSYYGPYNTTDENLSTAWSEGATGDGLGEWIEISAPTPQQVRGVSIVNGYPKSSTVYYTNNRPKAVTITLSDGYVLHTTLADDYGTWQDVPFDGVHETTYVRLTIDSVYDGSEFYDTCLAEFAAY